MPCPIADDCPTGAHRPTAALHIERKIPFSPYRNKARSIDEHIPEDISPHCFSLVRRRERNRRTQGCEQAARRWDRQRRHHSIQGRESLLKATWHAPLREDSIMRSGRDSGSVSQAENSKNTKVRTKIIIFGSFAVSFIPFIRGWCGPGRVVPRSAAIQACAAEVPRQMQREPAAAGRSTKKETNLNSDVNLQELRDRFAQFLRRKSYRNTQERYLVLEAVVTINKHFSADELYLYIHSEGAKVSRATVYSTLDLLTKCNILVKHRFDGEGAHYELADKMPNHDHLICTECGHIIEFQENETLSEIEANICSRFGFKPVKHAFNIYATCNDPGHCEHNRT